MRYLLLLIIIASAGYFGYEHINLKKDLKASQQELSEVKEELEKAKKATRQRRSPMGGPMGSSQMAGAPGAPPVPSGPQEIVCPFCKGEGQYALKSGAGHTRYAGCPLCASTGKHIIRLPNKPGVSICPDCKGLGKMVDKGGGIAKTGRVSVTIDRRCKGKGYFVK